MMRMAFTENKDKFEGILAVGYGGNVEGLSSVVETQDRALFGLKLSCGTMEELSSRSTTFELPTRDITLHFVESRVKLHCS